MADNTLFDNNNTAFTTQSGLLPRDKDPVKVATSEGMKDGIYDQSSGTVVPNKT